MRQQGVTRCYALQPRRPPSIIEHAKAPLLKMRSDSLPKSWYRTREGGLRGRHPSNTALSLAYYSAAPLVPKGSPRSLDPDPALSCLLEHCCTSSALLPSLCIAALHLRLSCCTSSALLHFIICIAALHLRLPCCCSSALLALHQCCCTSSALLHFVFCTSPAPCSLDLAAKTPCPAWIALHTSLSLAS